MFLGKLELVNAVHDRECVLANLTALFVTLRMTPNETREKGCRLRVCARDPRFYEAPSHLILSRCGNEAAPRK